MMQFVTPNSLFHVTSHGNGWAYEVTQQSTGASLWFQDDDATMLQNDTEDFTNESALNVYFETLCE